MAIQVDPRDAGDPRKTVRERIVDEIRKGVSGFFGSFGFHLLLLVLIYFISIQSGVDPLGGGGVDFSMELSDDVEEQSGNETKIPVERKPITTNKAPVVVKKNKQAKRGKKKVKPVGVGVIAQPVKPVDVKSIFKNREPESRDRILKEIDPKEKIRRAIAAGLRWLKRQQQSSGNWKLHTGYPDPGYEHLKTDTGATALALLAYLGDGHDHKKRGMYRETVAKGIKWLIGVQQPNGDFHDSQELGRQTAFYAHAQATIVICEAYALTNDETLKKPAERALKYLVESQNPVKGGWKYQPQGPNSRGDLSVTGWALMALHSGRAAGLDVPQEAFELSSLFLDSVSMRDGAHYRYEPPPTPRSVTPTMTAEGLLCRQFLGWPRNHPPLVDGVAYLKSERNLPRWEARGTRGGHVYYWYYAGHVLHNLGGKTWEDWYGKTAAMIVEHQKKTGTRKYDVRGSWDTTDAKKVHYGYSQIGGRLYMTAMCLLVLELPIRHRSLYDREEGKPPAEP